MGRSDNKNNQNFILFLQRALCVGETKKGTMLRAATTPLRRSFPNSFPTTHGQRQALRGYHTISKLPGISSITRFQPRRLASTSTSTKSVHDGMHDDGLPATEESISTTTTTTTPTPEPLMESQIHMANGTISSTDITALDASVPIAQVLLESLHSVTGLEWWTSIAALSFLLRLVLTLPTSLYAANQSRLHRHLAPLIQLMEQQGRLEMTRYSNDPRQVALTRRKMRQVCHHETLWITSSIVIIVVTTTTCLGHPRPLSAEWILPGSDALATFAPTTHLRDHVPVPANVVRLGLFTVWSPIHDRGPRSLRTTAAWRHTLVPRFDTAGFHADKSLAAGVHPLHEHSGRVNWPHDASRAHRGH